MDRAPRDSDLRFHGLEQLAIRSRHRVVEDRQHAEAAERTAVATSLLAPLVLQRILAAVDEPIVLMKGPEVAQWWHDPLTRPYRDVDVLVEDSEATWHTLRAAGFQPTGDPALYLGIHHLRPLVWPGLPLVVEVHHEPKWIEGATPPTAELLRTAVPSATGIDGLLALEPARHAVALAVHAWAHVPLGRLGRLVDVAALSQGADRGELVRIARSWDVERLWHTTQATIDSLFGDRRRPLVGHLWARHLWERPRTHRGRAPPRAMARARSRHCRPRRRLRQREGTSPISSRSSTVRRACR